MERRRRGGGRRSRVDRHSLVSAVVAVLRVATDARVTVALRDLADALEAHDGSRSSPMGCDEAVEPGPTIIVEPPEVTDEHRLYVEQRLRKAGVLR